MRDAGSFLERTPCAAWVADHRLDRGGCAQCRLSRGTAQAAADYTETYPVDFVMTNPCNGEEVTLSGSAHEQARRTDNGDGSIRIASHLNCAEAAP
jgi:hypothetical protein